ncbi:MAG: LuxR C-terminal-related transcriptional regulator [Planctomycetota bacterium]
MSIRLRYGRPLYDTATVLANHLLTGGSLDTLHEEADGESVFLTNAGGVLVWSSVAYRDFFAKGIDPIGRRAETFLDASYHDTTRQTDTMVLSHVRRLEFEHEGRGPDGCTYLLHTSKQALQHVATPGMAILGVSRPVAIVADRGDEVPLTHVEQCKTFHELGERTRWICQQIALGRSSRQIGEDLGISRRAVELQKEKAFRALGVGKGVELVRLLVRLQDRGYVDLGL